jgi:serine/threonine protein kinase
MELLGESLNSLLSQQTKFKLPTVVDLGRQVLGRLKSLHSKGFVHRDVKPPNLLLSRRSGSKKVYLIDFGLSDRYILTR